MSLDYKGLAELAKAFADSQNKVTSQTDTLSFKFTQDPIKFFKEQSELTRQIFQDELIGARNANKAIMTKIPVTVTKIGRNNDSMQSIPLIQLCNEEMGYAYRTSKGILNTKDSKYSNAEVEADNFDNFIVDAIKADNERWIMEWVMPVIDPRYDADRDPFRLGRDPDAEDIAVYEAKTDRTKKQSEIISTLVNTGYKLDLETGEIVEDTSAPTAPENPTQPDTQPQAPKKEETTDTKNSEEEADDLIDEDQARKKGNAREFFARAGKKNDVEKALGSSDYRKFEKLVRDSTIDQLEYYSRKLEEYDSLEEAQKKLERDLPALSSSGLPVNTLKAQLRKFADRAVDDFRSNASKRALEQYRSKYVRAEDDDEEWVYPQEILDIIDAKSQILLKGWDSLSDDQRSLIKEYFPGYKNYMGVDKELSSEINTIIKTRLEDGTGVAQAVQDILEKAVQLSEMRAFRIAQTETSQALTVTRRYLYVSNGYKWKMRVTVGDERVRPTHADDATAGWVRIDEVYPASGEMSPAEAILCRCTERYSDDDEPS